MDSFEDFNIRDPKYKKVEDLPRAVQPDFVNVTTDGGEGFAPKTAAEGEVFAERKAYENKVHGKNASSNPYNSADILHQEALDYERK